MDPDLASRPRVRLALVALIVSVFLLMWAVVRAVRVEPTDVPATSTASKPVATSLQTRAVQVAPELVVETDIFAIDRLPPLLRYPMPGDVRRVTGTAVAEPPPTMPSVLGTAVGLDGATFATASLPDSPPRIVRVGDRLGIYTIVAITRGTVTFRAANTAPFQITAP